MSAVAKSGDMVAPCRANSSRPRPDRTGVTLRGGSRRMLAARLRPSDALHCTRGPADCLHAFVDRPAPSPHTFERSLYIQDATGLQFLKCTYSGFHRISRHKMINVRELRNLEARGKLYGACGAFGSVGMDGGGVRGPFWWRISPRFPENCLAGPVSMGSPTRRALPRIRPLPSLEVSRVISGHLIHLEGELSGGGWP